MFVFELAPTFYSLLDLPICNIEMAFQVFLPEIVSVLLRSVINQNPSASVSFAGLFGCLFSNSMIK